jgi:hypothetical protein
LPPIHAGSCRFSTRPIVVAGTPFGSADIQGLAWRETTSLWTAPLSLCSPILPREARRSSRA